ncbi:hypothetical protein ACH3XW_50030 [Acanthocheilonema viteae]
MNFGIQFIWHIIEIVQYTLYKEKWLRGAVNREVINRSGQRAIPSKAEEVEEEKGYEKKRIRKGLRIVKSEQHDAI